MHRVRDRLVARRTSVINQLRAFLLKRGMVFAKTPFKLKQAMPEILQNADANLTPPMRNLVSLLWSEWKDLEQQTVAMNVEAEQIASSDPACQRLRQIPGIGPLVATAIVAALGNRAAFNKAGISPPDWDLCRDSTRPAARRDSSASASEATAI
jgi:transposase